MAVSEMAYSQVQLLDEQSMSIVPSVVGTEWVIHNVIIPYGYTCELYHTDGTNSIKIMTLTNSLLSYSLHCNTSSYYTLKNISSYTIYTAYDGIITSE